MPKPVTTELKNEETEKKNPQCGDGASDGLRFSDSCRCWTRISINLEHHILESRLRSEFSSPDGRNVLLESLTCSFVSILLEVPRIWRVKTRTAVISCHHMQLKELELPQWASGLREPSFEEFLTGCTLKVIMRKKGWLLPMRRMR